MESIAWPTLLFILPSLPISSACRLITSYHFLCVSEGLSYMYVWTFPSTSLHPSFNSELMDCRNCSLRSEDFMLMYLMFLLFERECGPRWVSSEDVAWPPWRPKPNHGLRPSPDSHTKGKRSPRAFIWVERGSTEPETSEMDCCSLYPTKSVWPETVWNLIRPTVMFSNIFFKCVHLSRHGINSLNLKKNVVTRWVGAPIVGARRSKELARLAINLIVFDEVITCLCRMYEWKWMECLHHVWMKTTVCMCEWQCVAVEWMCMFECSRIHPRHAAQNNDHARERPKDAKEPKDKANPDDPPSWPRHWPSWWSATCYSRHQWGLSQEPWWQQPRRGVPAWWRQDGPSRGSILHACQCPKSPRSVDDNPRHGSKGRFEIDADPSTSMI